VKESSSNRQDVDTCGLGIHGGKVVEFEVFGDRRGLAAAARRRDRTAGTMRALRNPGIWQTVKEVFVLAKILSAVPRELRPGEQTEDFVRFRIEACAPLGLRMG
jgi:hypothetical protein